MPILRLRKRRHFLLRRYVDAPSPIGYGGTRWGSLMAEPKPYEPPVCDEERPLPKPDTGKIAVKVINRYGDEVLKVYKV